MTHTLPTSVLNRIFSALRFVQARAVTLIDFPRHDGNPATRNRLPGVLALAALLSLSGTAHAGSLYLSKLSGANENPPTTSTATGVGVLILNDAENQATVTATHDISIPVTGGHIHRAPITGNGPVILGFPAPSSPVGPLTWNIPATELDNLKNLGLYFNFHTAVNPGGAIRGQIFRALLAPAATNAAQVSLANALDVSAGYDADLNQILIQTNLAATAVQTQTLNDLSARTVYAPIRQEIEVMASLTDSVFAYADAVRESPGSETGHFSVFLRGGNEFGDRSASANQAGSTISRPFMMGGADYRFSELTRGGLAVAYAKGEDEFDAGAGKTTTKLTTLHGFLSTKVGNSGLALDGAIGYGRGKVDSTRNITSLARTATASPSGSVWSAALKVSKAFTLSNESTLIPYAFIDGQEARLDGYSETGAGAAGLMVPGRTSWNSAIEGGATLLIPIKLQSATLTARLLAGWHYQLEDGAATIATRLVGSPVAFPTRIEGPGKSAAHVEASLTATMTNGMLATLGYRGLLGASGQTTHAIEARIVFKM